MKLNKAQQRSLKYQWDRDNDNRTYLQFRRSVQPGLSYRHADDLRHANSDSELRLVVVQWCGMWLGIEWDGYTHT